MERRLTAVLAADVVGYSRLMGADEAGTLDALSKLRSEFIDGKIAEHQGRLVKLTGDGLLLEFPSVVNAVRCAAEIQCGMRDRNANLPPEKRIEFRIGVNLGDVIVQDESTIANTAPNRDQRPSIAVLPFSNMSGDPEQEYFSDGITEDIITDLSKVSGLWVAARNTVFTYKGKPATVEQIARELGVAYILEGSVRKAGARVRVTGQLTSTKDGGNLWADRFDRDLTDIFAIQDEITHAIVAQLKVKLLPQEAESIGQDPTDNVEAYTYYLRGRDFLHRRSKHYCRIARQMFAKAVALDPNYARAYAGMADCDSFLYLNYRVDVPIDALLATTEKALSLDNTLPEAHASRGHALAAARRYPEANAEFEKAIALDPNLFEAYYGYARASFAEGQLEQAARLFERASQLRRDDYQSVCLLIHIYRSLGRLADCKDAARRGIELAEKELSSHPDDPRPAHLGAGALFELGEMERAREWISRALAIDPDDPLTLYNVACGLTKLRDYDQAFALLERAIAGGGPELVNWVKYDSDLDGLRNDARYPALLARVNELFPDTK